MLRFIAKFLPLIIHEIADLTIEYISWKREENRRKKEELENIKKQQSE